MDALAYEHLIRAAFQCDRTSNNGADADIYRRLERAERLYQLEKENEKNGRPRLREQSIEELAGRYAYACGEVSGFVSTAIRKILKERSLTEEQSKILEQCKTDLLNADIQVIDNVIDRALTITASIRLHPK